MVDSTKVLAVPGSVDRGSGTVLRVGTAVSFTSSAVVADVSKSATVSVLSLFKVVSVSWTVGVSVVRTTGRIV